MNWHLNYHKKIFNIFCAPHIKKLSSLTKIEKRYEELLEENKKLEKINQKIEKHEIIEIINIKEIESEILDETKTLEKIITKLEKLEATIIKKKVLEWNDEQEILENLKIKIETEKLNKIEGKENRKT